LRVRRRHERFVRRLESEFIGEGKSYRAISSDFSRYGLFIRTNHAFVPGTELDITVHLPNGTHCQLKGIVRRAIKTPIVSLKNGMGIELLERDHNYIRFLKKFDPTEDAESAPVYREQTSQKQPEQHPLPEQQHTPSPEQAAEFIIVRCGQCGVRNKVLGEKPAHGHRCGKCGSPLSPQA
jgi:ribosomal protein S27E